MVLHLTYGPIRNHWLRRLTGHPQGPGAQILRGVLGLKPAIVAPGKIPKWIECNIGPSTLAIGSSDLWKPSKNGASAALAVKNFEAAVALLTKHKIKFILGPVDFSSCRMVAFRDPEGNKLNLHQREPPPKNSPRKSRLSRSEGAAEFTIRGRHAGRNGYLEHLAAR